MFTRYDMSLCRQRYVIEAARVFDMPRERVRYVRRRARGDVLTRFSA